MSASAKSRAQAAGFAVREGRHTNTPDDQIGRWYVERADGDPIDRDFPLPTGEGYESYNAAWRAIDAGLKTVAEPDMTPEQLVEKLEITGWGMQTMANKFRYTRQGVEQWKNGRVRIPQPVAEWLKAHAEWMLANPPPTR